MPIDRSAAGEPRTYTPSRIANEVIARARTVVQTYGERGGTTGPTAELEDALKRYDAHRGDGSGETPAQLIQNSDEPLP